MPELHDNLMAEDEPLRQRLFGAWGVRSWANIGNHAWSPSPRDISDADRHWLPDVSRVPELPEVDAAVIHFTCHWWPDPVLLLSALYDRLNVPGYLLLFVAHHERIVGEWCEEAFCGHGDAFGPIGFGHDFGYAWIVRKLHRAEAGEVVCHAAAVRYGEHVALIGGAGRAGKTTLALQLNDLGYPCMCDDRVSLRGLDDTASGVFARGVTDEASLRHDAMRLSPSIERVLDAHPVGWDPSRSFQTASYLAPETRKHRFSIREVSTGRLDVWLHVGLVLLLRSEEDGHHLQRIDGHEGARRLFSGRPRCLDHNLPTTLEAEHRISDALARSAAFYEGMRPSPTEVLDLFLHEGHQIPASALAKAQGDMAGECATPSEACRDAGRETL
jgi:hypothetical protein